MRISRVLSFFVTACTLAAQFHLPGAGSAKPPKSGKQSDATSASTTTPAAKSQAAGIAGAFDYYVLSLSWVPEFCASQSNASANPQECVSGKDISFSVHGLWPEANTGASPENCGGAKSVPSGIVKSVLPYMFSASLVQHEWTTHGTCSGLSQNTYFTDILQARTSVQIPVQFTSLDSATTETPAQIESQFAEANTEFPAGTFRTHCQNGNLVEVRVCFDKNIKPQECTPSVGECTNESIHVLPVR